jgi:hypothetical protein
MNFDETEYYIYCKDSWVAGANDLDEAMSYAHQYREEGRVEVYEIQKKKTLVAKMSMLRKAQEK